MLPCILRPMWKIDFWLHEIPPDESLVNNEVPHTNDLEPQPPQKVVFFFTVVREFPCENALKKALW